MSKAHYMATVIVFDKLMHTMVDTCGAKSMIDRRTAEELGLKIELATKDRHFGSYYGPGNENGAYYYGRIKGPLKVDMGSNVRLNLDELKVVEHFEPLLLIGTDVLSDQPGAEWQFCYVGLHPETRQGNLVVCDAD